MKSNFYSIALLTPISTDLGASLSCLDHCDPCMSAFSPECSLPWSPKRNGITPECPLPQPPKRNTISQECSLLQPFKRNAITLSVPYLSYPREMTSPQSVPCLSCPRETATCCLYSGVYVHFWDRVSLGSPGCSQTGNPPASVSQVLGLQLCTTPGCLHFFLFLCFWTFRASLDACFLWFFEQEWPL